MFGECVFSGKAFAGVQFGKERGKGGADEFGLLRLVALLCWAGNKKGCKMQPLKPDQTFSKLERWFGWLASFAV